MEHSAIKAQLLNLAVSWTIVMWDRGSSTVSVPKTEYMFHSICAIWPNLLPWRLRNYPVWREVDGWGGNTSNPEYSAGAFRSATNCSKHALSATSTTWMSVLQHGPSVRFVSGRCRRLLPRRYGEGGICRQWGNHTVLSKSVLLFDLLHTKTIHGRGSKLHCV